MNTEKDKVGRYINIATIGAVCILLLYFIAHFAFREYYSRHNTIELKGTIHQAGIQVKTVTERRKFEDRKHQVAELYFSLVEYNKLFSLREDIGYAYQSAKFNLYRKQLLRSDSVKVLINKEDASIDYPEVLSVYADNKELVNFESSIERKEIGYGILIVVFVLFICSHIFKNSIRAFINK